ncbi:hypothetical protein LTR85_012133 [Meristemomyces frigidus]|nr:hypothetical protein LTR85_012133 [Meristemomyces frigidus]
MSTNEMVETSATSTARALNIVELLEHVFTSLYASDLLYAQLVNKQWHDVIERSSKLKMNLFLEAEPHSSYLIHSHSSEKRVINSWVIAKHHPAFKGDYIDQYTTYSEMSISYADLMRGGPGMWEDMFVMQPPCQAMSVSLFSHGSYPPKSSKMFDEDGITMGALQVHVVDAAAKLRAQLLPEGCSDEDPSRELSRVYVRVGGFIHASSKYVRQARAMRESKGGMSPPLTGIGRVLEQEQLRKVSFGKGTEETWRPRRRGNGDRPWSQAGD